MFQGCQIVQEESRGAKSEGLFHTLGYYNQYDHLCEGKVQLSSMLKRLILISSKTSGDLSFAGTEIHQQ